MKNKEITMYELIGLIKNDKAPKKIKIDDDIWYFVKRYDGNYYIDKEEYCFHCCQLGFDYYIENNKLNDIVEILPEENDEWEDIEELCILKTHEYNTTTVQTNRIVINKLIKNQKYLKERLDKDER